MLGEPDGHLDKLIGSSVSLLLGLKPNKDQELGSPGSTEKARWVWWPSCVQGVNRQAIPKQDGYIDQPKG